MHGCRMDNISRIRLEGKYRKPEESYAAIPWFATQEMTKLQSSQAWSGAGYRGTCLSS
jgi:hypothetical protein